MKFWKFGKLKIVSLLAAALAVAGAGCSSGTTEEQPAARAAAEKRTDAYASVFELSFDDYEGNAHTLSDEAGTPLVINSWAAWCPFCKQELVDFALLQRQFAGSVKFIAVNRAESLAVARAYTDASNISGEMLFLLDPRDAFYSSIGGFAMPETLFVDGAGQVVLHKRGPLSLEETQAQVESLLK